VPEFTNPFPGVVPRKMTNEELIRAIRLDIAAEHEATHIYMAHADATDHPLAKKVLIDIANEEREHVGEFMRVLSLLAPDEDQWLANGVAEVDEMIAELEAGAPAEDEQAETTESETAPEASGPPSLGSMR